MSARAIAILYLVYAIAALFPLAVTMPPFENPDEAAHAYRADQISHLDILIERLPDGAQGGWIDAGLPQASAPFEKLRFHQTRKISRAMYAPQPWGPRVPVGFPNTGVYPPTF